MGCASSSPLVERGRKIVDGAKETVSDSISKGEHVLQDVGDTAQAGMKTVKDTIHTAVASTEEGVETVIGKIGDTFNFHSSKAIENLDDLESKKDNYVTNASDAAAEVVSEAETILASETESAKDDFVSKVAPVFESIHSSEDHLKEAMRDVKENAVEDLEDLEATHEKLEDLEVGVQKIEGNIEQLNDSFGGLPKKESKEELSPTIWEAAADAILLQRTLKALDFPKDPERHFFTQPDSEVGDSDSGVAINTFLTRDNESNDI